MNGSTQVALFALISGLAVVLGPIFLSWLQGRQRRAEKKDESELRQQEKKQDYARQDEVAAAVAKVAAAAEAKADEDKRVQAEVDEQLKIIHGLVNNQLTNAIVNEYDATVRSLVVMLELAEIKTKSGLAITPDYQKAIDAAKTKIAQLERTITERKVQQDMIDKNMAEAAKQKAGISATPSGPIEVLVINKKEEAVPVEAK